MPIAVKDEGPNLAIRLDAPKKQIFSTGDVLAGVVIRDAPLTCSRAILSISLVGRSKSKITKVQGAGGTVHYRGRYEFFNHSDKDTFQVLYDGPLQILPAGEPLALPFAIAIPKSPSLKKKIHKKEDIFISQKTQDIATQSIPGTFFSAHINWDLGGLEAYVEYYLRAEIRVVKEDSSPPEIATLPIQLRGPPVTKLITNFGLKNHSFTRLIKTYNLLPGSARRNLSLTKKTQKLFHSSKIPHVTATLSVETPSIIQLENPTPIPFRVRIRHDYAHTSDVVKRVPQVYILTSVKLELQPQTWVIAPGDVSRSTHRDSHMRKLSLGLEQLFDNLEKPIIIPSGPIDPPLNVGALLQLVLHADHLSAAGRPLERAGKIYPDFTTFNVKHGHRMEWSLSFEVARESHTVTFHHPVDLVGPFEEQSSAPKLNLPTTQLMHQYQPIVPQELP